MFLLFSCDIWSRNSAKTNWPPMQMKLTRPMTSKELRYVTAPVWKPSLCFALHVQLCTYFCLVKIDLSAKVCDYRCITFSDRSTDHEHGNF